MHLTNGQRAVLKAIRDFGKCDDVALTVYVHHVADYPMSSSGIRSRRAELERKGAIMAVGEKRLASGRAAAIHAISPNGRKALRAKAV